MRKMPGYHLPNYSAEIGEDTLFHYTSATGLIGILQTGQIWCTAAHCTNDETELTVGEEFLSREFSNVVQELMIEKDPIVEVFLSRGVNPYEYADSFKDLLIGILFSRIKAYLACFCQAADREVFYHGLLSQWRAYGIDGGYAIQFSKKKMIEAADIANNENSEGFDIEHVYYSSENPLKKELIGHIDSFHASFKKFVTDLAEPLSFAKDQFQNPLADLTKEPLEALLKYLLFTKNPHFSEERETRLGHIALFSEDSGKLKRGFFNRNGMVVPYTETNSDSFKLLDCMEGIIIGPGPRMPARFESVLQLVRSTGRKIPVRASQIPFTRN